MERNHILKSINEKSQEFDALVEQLRSVHLHNGHSFDIDFTLETVGLENEASLRLLETLRTNLHELIDSYRQGLSNKPFSRCPFTGKTVSLSIDTEGIDGLWWNSDNPIRLDAEAPKTFFAYDGAMKLNDQIESTLFPVLPGPNSPFVLTRLLQYDQVKAVISQVNVGLHAGYLITYFCDPFLIYEPRINDWGTRRYWESNPLAGDFTTPGKWISLDPLKSELDFDLAYWMAKGKLFWIKPGDTSLRLRVAIDECPFLQIEGNGKYQEIKQGQHLFLQEFETIYRSIDEFYSLFPDDELQIIQKEIDENIIEAINETINNAIPEDIATDSKKKEVTTHDNL